MNLFEAHEEGCMPIERCRYCKAVEFLRKKLTAHDVDQLMKSLQGARPAQEQLTPILDLDLEPRTVRTLLNAGITTAEQLTKKHPHELKRLHDMNAAGLHQIVVGLARKGFQLSEV